MATCLLLSRRGRFEGCGCCVEDRRLRRSKTSHRGRRRRSGIDPVDASTRGADDRKTGNLRWRGHQTRRTRESDCHSFAIKSRDGFTLGDQLFLQQFVECCLRVGDDKAFYVGGRPRRYFGYTHKHKTGRGTHKVPVMGIVRRDGDARFQLLLVSRRIDSPKCSQRTRTLPAA